MASAAERRGLWRVMRERYSWRERAASSSCADGLRVGIWISFRMVGRGVTVWLKGWCAARGEGFVSAAAGGGGGEVWLGFGEWKSWKSQVRERVSMFLEAQTRRSNPFLPWSMEGVRRLSSTSIGTS